MTTRKPAGAKSRRRTAPVVTLLTDFGSRDGFVGIVKGVILKICPEARLVDLSHEIAPQDIVGGALVLASAVRWFPPGTVHLAVVDPGVGGARRPIAIETADFTLVGPDNGLLSLAARQAEGRRIVELRHEASEAGTVGHTFHARDLFAPAAAHLAAGTAIAKLGGAVRDLVTIDVPAPRRIDDVLEGQVLYVDRFGNLVTNIGREDLAAFRPEDVSVSIREVQIAGIATHYSAVREGRPLAVWNSWDRLEVAVRNGSAARHLRARAGDRVEIRARESRR